MKERSTWAHVTALAVILVWGITFVSTKVLLDRGMTPSAIMFYRFLVAYLLILPLTARQLLAGSFRDELLFVALGITGGSLYFIAENVALQHTRAANVALLVCTAPLFTAFLSGLILRERPRANQWWGSMIALSGVALVVFNGQGGLQLDLAGDLLSIAAAVSWALYTIILRRLDSRYSTLFVTRKVFFYGLVTLLPVLRLDARASVSLLFSSPVVLWNLLFLGVLASFLCYIFWNRVIACLGAIRASNYIYLNPVVTLVASAIILSERATSLAVLGTILVLGGVYLAGRSKR